MSAVPRRGPLFWGSAAAGWALILWGVRGALHHRIDTRPGQLVRFLLGQLNVTALYLVRTALLSAAYNALLTPIFYPVIRRAAEASRTRRVTRW